MPIDEKDASTIAAKIPVAVILAYPKDPDDQAEPETGEVIGVVTRPPPKDTGIRKQLIHSDANGQQFLWTGFAINLHPDAAESYYFNLMGEKPSVFVVCRLEQGRLRPFLASCSYDEADSYMEVDESVAAVAMPPEIYRACEAFVLTHYVPEKKLKRKRDDWERDGRRP